MACAAMAWDAMAWDAMAWDAGVGRPHQPALTGLRYTHAPPCTT
jgi:hypothetical protein